MERDKGQGCWEGSSGGLGDSRHIRNEGSGAIKTAFLALSSAGWENNDTSRRKGGWGSEERMCFVSGTGGAFGTSSGNFLWAAGNGRLEPELELQILERKRGKG